MKPKMRGLNGVGIQMVDRDRIRKICTHEAGHYVVAKELGFTTDGISASFKMRDGHSGSAVILPRTPGIVDLITLEHYLERRIQVLYAGVLAEAMSIDGNFDGEYATKNWETGGGMNDHAKIRELGQVLRNIKFPISVDEESVNKELAELNDTLGKKAGQLVVKRLELIHGIGGSLAEKVLEYDVMYEMNEVELNGIPMVRELYGDKSAMSSNA